MAWLSRLRKNEQDRQINDRRREGQGQTVGGAGNRYDPTLLSTLKAEHLELISLYTEIGTLFKHKKFDDVLKHLLIFKKRLESHLLSKNFSFYAYLEEYLTIDKSSAQIMRDFRRETNAIAREIMHFVRTYQAKGVGEGNAASFWLGYVRIGGVLRQRIEQEELSLHPLYLPPYAY